MNLKKDLNACLSIGGVRLYKDKQSFKGFVSIDEDAGNNVIRLTTTFKLSLNDVISYNNESYKIISYSLANIELYKYSASKLFMQ